MKKILSILAVLVGLTVSAANVVDVSVRALDGFGGDTSAVLTRCQTRTGSVYDPVTVSRDVNALTNSGEFQEITADARRVEDGVEVVFYVKRKLRYHAPLTVKGANYFSESKIAKLAELKDGALYSEGDFAAAAARVRLAYQKKDFRNAKVVPIPTVESGNNCQLTFMVDEGRRQNVHAYVFQGADVEGINMDELHDVVGDQPWWNPVGWFADDPVTRDQLAQTSMKVRECFVNAGYLDAAVSEPQAVVIDEEEEEDEIDLVYTINPGQRYTIGATKITGLTKYPEPVVREKSELPPAGTIAGEKTLNDAAHRIEVVVGSGDSGLADTHVMVRQIPTDKPGVLDIDFVVTEGVPVVINQVVIEGNDYTKDKVIRREIALGPGDRMLADRAETSQKRLENLDYFSRVRYYLRKTNKGTNDAGEEYRDLVYEVEEKNTGSFMVGIGASSVDSIYLSAEVSQSNFDIFAPSKYFRGGGQKARLYGQVGPRIQTYEAMWSEPHLFDRLLELTVELYRRQRWYDDYDIVRTGGAVGLSYPVKFWPTWDPFGRFGVRLSGEFIQFEDVDTGTWTYNGHQVSLVEEDRLYGDAFEPVVRFYWSHDTRDSFRMPTRGSRTQIFFDLAPAGDNQYYKVGFNHRNYFTTWKKYGNVLMVALRAESIDGISDEIPIYNRLFLGGPKSIRGIEYRGVSPYARRNGSGEWTPWGGQTLACMNLEYTIPIVKMLRLAAFTDIGSVSESEFDLSDDFAWTIGVGIRLDIPMFPIRLDFATPIEKPEHAEKEVFSFTVGYDF